MNKEVFADRVNSKLFELESEIQDKILAEFNYDERLSSRHCALVHFINEHYQRPDSYRSIDDPNYREPTKEEISEVIEHLAKIHSKTIVSKQLGLKIESNPTKTINRWMKGESSIPYTAWRMLLILDGRVIETNRIPDGDGYRAWEKFYGKNVNITD